MDLLNLFVWEGEAFLGFASLPRGAKIFLGLVNLTERLFFESLSIGAKDGDEEPDPCVPMDVGSAVNWLEGSSKVSRAQMVHNMSRSPPNRSF